MISLTSAQLDAWIAAFVYPMARILALTSAAPVIGSTGVPRRIRLGLGLALTLAIVPLAGTMPEVSPGSWEGLTILIEQIVIGVAMGFAMRIAFSAIDMTGELIGLQMGLGFATFFDPQHGNNSPVIAQLLGLLATLFFLALNGHLLIVSTLAQSFSALPVGAAVSGGHAAYSLASWGGQIFVSGLALALPVVAALVITNIALGILTRTAPQLNVFAVGFPITLMLGFFMLALALPYLTAPLERLLSSGMSAAMEVARQAGTVAQ
jgi:flagellar biosynthetic protein FliR